MKIDRDVKTTKEAGGTVQPDSQSRPRGGAEGLYGLAWPNEAEAETLAAKVNQLPEADSKKVVSLKAAMQKGTYQASPEKTADAILSEMEVRAQHLGLAGAGESNTAVPGPEPLVMYARLAPASKRGSRGATPASGDGKLREVAQTSRDRRDLDQTDSDQMDSSA
jgi:anti-sigma28 factor (negative regulator of flagellin synthesis)